MTSHLPAFLRGFSSAGRVRRQDKLLNSESRGGLLAREAEADQCVWPAVPLLKEDQAMDSTPRVGGNLGV